MSILFAISAAAISIVLLVAFVCHWFFDCKSDWTNRPEFEPEATDERWTSISACVGDQLKAVKKEIYKKNHDRIVLKIRSQHRKMIEDRVTARKANETYEQRLCREAELESFAWLAEQEKKDREMWAACNWNRKELHLPNAKLVCADVIDRVRSAYSFCNDTCIW